MQEKYLELDQVRLIDQWFIDWMDFPLCPILKPFSARMFIFCWGWPRVLFQGSTNQWKGLLHVGWFTIPKVMLEPSAATTQWVVYILNDRVVSRLRCHNMALKWSHMWEETSKEEGEEHNYIRPPSKLLQWLKTTSTFMELMKEGYATRQQTMR